ncbi:MAG: RsmB/NOP family class I SAM-dependent RNA methyltransferase [Candidatus Omnitrophica bacterium]|nr:RsmB/NOP family class I SAM-dependent RNA methyltransferase [Candidatus Omnitrophota bacterium]
MIPVQKFDQIANTFASDKPTTFRVNTLKASRETVREKLEHISFRLEPVPWYPDAFILRGGRLRDLEKTEIYSKGEIYVQSLSSMIPPLVLGPYPISTNPHAGLLGQSGEAILDLAAAPGSKTTQMASFMKGEGRIVANESDRIRYAKLKANVELQGAKNVEVVLGHGESLGKKFPECFDRVLLDAPCSAEGRFEASEPSSYRYWKLEKVYENAKLQKKLLASAISALKPNGVLVYSTCTFAPEENEAVIQDALEKYGPSLQIEPIKLSFSNQMSGLSKWEGKLFHPSIKNTVRILPTSEMEAFFIARISKKA